MKKHDACSKDLPQHGDREILSRRWRLRPREGTGPVFPAAGAPRPGGLGVGCFSLVSTAPTVSLTYSRVWVKFYHSRQLFVNKASVAPSTLGNADMRCFEVFVLSFQNPFKNTTWFIPHTQPVSGKAGCIIAVRRRER